LIERRIIGADAEGSYFCGSSRFLQCLDEFLNGNSSRRSPLIGRRNRRLEHIKVDVQIELLDLLRDGDEFGWQLMRLREPADSEFLQKQGFAGLGRPGI